MHNSHKNNVAMLTSVSRPKTRSDRKSIEHTLLFGVLILSCQPSYPHASTTPGPVVGIDTAITTSITDNKLKNKIGSIDMLHNIFKAAEAGDLLLPSFYTDKNLLLMTGGKKISASRDPAGGPRSGEISDFGNMFPKLTVGNADVEGADVHFQRKEDERGITSAYIMLKISTSKDTGLSFESVTRSLGANWHELTELAPPPPETLVPLPTSAHGNQSIQYMFASEKKTGSATLTFLPNGNLSTATFFAERK